MSVLVKGMTMPKSCKTCDLLQDYDGCMYCPFGDCTVFGDIEYVPNHVASDICPLVELPEKHGRLIDADELKTAFPRCDNNMNIKIASARATINHMPTIIEAEGMEE